MGMNENGKAASFQYNCKKSFLHKGYWGKEKTNIDLIGTR